MLEENKNTYATVEFADEYIAEHYATHNPLRVHFSVLTDEEKGTYLRKALQEIERLHFIGRKYLVSQPLQFPRIRQGSLYGMSPTYAAMFIGNTGEYSTPECVRQAQVENALGILSDEIFRVSEKQTRSLNALGIIKNTKNENTAAFNTNACPLRSEKAYNLLREWLGGVYVC